MTQRPKVSVGIVVWRGDDVLLIRRGKPPYEGQWSIPGGSVEFGERLHAAALRELLEETGVQADILGLVDVFESITKHGHYVMVDYVARWRAGAPQAGDDALDAAFVPHALATQRVGWDETRTVIEASRRVLQRHDLALIDGQDDPS